MFLFSPTSHHIVEGKKEEEDSSEYEINLSHFAECQQITGSNEELEVNWNKQKLLTLVAYDIPGAAEHVGPSGTTYMLTKTLSNDDCSGAIFFCDIDWEQKMFIFVK